MVATRRIRPTADARAAATRRNPGHRVRLNRQASPTHTAGLHGLAAPLTPPKRGAVLGAVDMAGRTTLSAGRARVPCRCLQPNQKTAQLLARAACTILKCCSL